MKGGEINLSGTYLQQVWAVNNIRKAKSNYESRMMRHAKEDPKVSSDYTEKRARD